MLFYSFIKLAYPPEYNFSFQNVDEMGASNLVPNCVNCPSYADCVNWAMYQKNVSILLLDTMSAYAAGVNVGENSEPLLCRLEDGVVFTTGLSMVMSYGDPLLRAVTEIIDRVVEADLFIFWFSLQMHGLNLFPRKVAIVHQLDGYYSFNCVTCNLPSISY